MAASIAGSCLIELDAAGHAAMLPPELLEALLVEDPLVEDPLVELLVSPVPPAPPEPVVPEGPHARGMQPAAIAAMKSNLP